MWPCRPQSLLVTQNTDLTRHGRLFTASPLSNKTVCDTCWWPSAITINRDGTQDQIVCVLTTSCDHVCNRWVGGGVFSRLLSLFPASLKGVEVFIRGWVVQGRRWEGGRGEICGGKMGWQKVVRRRRRSGEEMNAEEWRESNGRFYFYISKSFVNSRSDLNGSQVFRPRQQM